MEALLYQAGFFLHSAALALAFAYLFSRREGWSLWMWRLLGSSLALELAAFAVRTSAFWSVADNRFYLPFHTLFGTLSWLSFSMAAIFWFVEGRHRLNILGAFVLPWSWLAGLAALAFADPALRDLEPSLRSPWMNVHPVVLMTAYAALANAFGVGVALLVQESQVKSRKPGELCFRLPAIEELDRLNFRLVLASLPLLTVGIAIGVVWAGQSWGRHWGWDAKETWAGITWLVYAFYLAARLQGRLRGPRSVYVSMIGFASVLITFFAVGRLSQLHNYLVGG